MITINNNDGFLQFLVIYVNAEDEEIPISVMMDGFIVTGNLVSGSRFFKEMKEHFPVTGKERSWVLVNTSENAT